METRMIDCSHSENPLHKSLTDSLVKCFADEEKGEQTILVPITAKDELDQDTPDPNDELAAELSMLQQKSKSVAIIGSRNIPLPHQQIVEMLAFSLTHEGNQLITSGGSSGTNAAAIRGAMRGNPDLLKVILPQTIGQQPSDVQDQLIGIPHIIEHPEWSMMKLADASRLCNREIIDEAQQLVILLTHDSPTLQGAIEYAEENHKIVTTLYLD
jgi:hypothetical protein